MDENMTRERAFEILQLDPSASTDKIKLKYENFMRRAKFDKDFDEELVTKAFDTIMGIHWGNFEPDPVYSEKGINKKKIENFFYHYKRHLAFGIPLLIMIIAVIVMLIVGGLNYDYKISLLGHLSLNDQELMAEYYQELLDVDEVLIDYYIVGDNEDGALTGDFINKLFGDLAGGESDLFISVPNTIKYLSYDGALLDLTPYLAELGISPDDENILYWYKDTGGEIAAAYRFGSNSIFTEGITGDVPEYFCIPHRAEFTEETKTIILDLIEGNK